MKFDYYYSREAEQFTFYRIPKALFTDSAFRSLSVEAKVLYGLMLDRMSLSLRSGWIDAQGRVYIYFTHADIQTHLGCGHSKATQLLRELDSGIGLIRRKRQGLGNPDIIYVMDFVTGIQTSDNQQPESAYEAQSAENQQPAQPYTPQNSDIQASENGISVPQSADNQQPKVPEIKPPECRKTAANKTEKTKTDFSDTESFPPRQVPAGRMRRMKDIRNMLKDKWGYIALDDGHHDMSEVNSIFTLGAEVLCSTKPTVRVNQEDIPREQVADRLLGLDFTHIDYVLDQIHANKKPIHNMYSYMLTLLYNAPLTIDAHYAAMVTRDMAESGSFTPDTTTNHFQV